MMKKRILAVVLAGAMAVTLVGCGSTAGKEPSTNEETKVEDVAPPTDDTIVDEPIVEDEVVADDNAETLPADDETTVEDTTSDATVEKDGTLGTALINQFNELAADDSKEIAEIAETLVLSDVIEFSGATMDVEPGYLTGFTEEIDGFDEGVMFGPIIGSMAFVGYVFTVSDDADAFLEKITSVSDPRWNICTEADETVSAIVGDKVCFIMCSNKEF